MKKISVCVCNILSLFFPSLFFQNIDGLRLHSFSARARQYSPENSHRSGARLNSRWLFVAASATRNAESSAGDASLEEEVAAAAAPPAAAAGSAAAAAAAAAPPAADSAAAAAAAAR